MRDPRTTLVLQQQALQGTEVILGATRDPKFGPLLMFGLGGIFVEVLKDVAFRVHPLSDLDAREMIRAVKGFPLLDGARGRPPADLAALEQVILRLDRLMALSRRWEGHGIGKRSVGPPASAARS